LTYLLNYGNYTSKAVLIVEKAVSIPVPAWS
jgi:hypothetical protein